MSTNEISSKIQQLQELRTMAVELQAEIDAIQDDLKNHMEAVGVDELHGFSGRVTWRSVESRRLDTTALRKALPVLCDSFTRTTTTRRFCLC